MLRLLTLWMFVSGLSAQAPTALISLQVANETAPPGGWAHIKVFLRTPALVRSGNLTLDLDPGIFGDIDAVSVFSSSGDAIGYARVSGRHVDAHFTSQYGGIGQLPDLPVLQITAPVLPFATPGATSIVSADPGFGWQAPGGRNYAVTIATGTFTVNGNLSVRRLTAATSPFPDGTNFEIEGTGFDATPTRLSIDGVNVTTIAFVNDHLLRAACFIAEITGKHVHVSNATESADFFAALPSAPANTEFALAGVHAILPLTPYTKATTTYNNLETHPNTVEAYALLNPNPTPVTVTIQGHSSAPFAAPLQRSITVPPGTLYFVSLNAVANSVQPFWHGQLWVTASAPLRMLDYVNVPSLNGAAGSVTVSPPQPFGSGPVPVQILANAASVAWSWQVGTPVPTPLPVNLSGDASANIGYDVSFSGAPWLSVAPATGTTPAILTFTPLVFNTKGPGLAPGKYATTVTIAPTLSGPLAGYPVLATTIAVALTVSADPLIDSSSDCCLFVVPASPAPRTVSITSNGSAAPLAAQTTTKSPANWLAATLSGATTPATLTMSANPNGLTTGQYQGQVTVIGPANSLTFPVELDIFPTGAQSLQVQPTALSFTLESGSVPPPGGQFLSIQPLGVSITASAQTESGGDWLAAQIFANAPNAASVRASANAQALQPGIYRGKVIITAGLFGSNEVLATLTVLPRPSTDSTLKVTPANLAINTSAGQTGIGQFTVDSGPTPSLFSISVEGGGWLQLRGITAASSSPDGRYSTPAVVTLSATATQPGVQYGSVTLTTTRGTVQVPVTYFFTASVEFPPTVSMVLSAASLRPGPLAPGEIFTIFGSGVGPVPKVLVDNLIAPVLFASSNQINAIVPYQAERFSGTARVQVISSDDAAASEWSVTEAASTPAIFTLSGSGVGQAAVLNQDNSVNAAGNPAARGSVIQIFATGEGQTSPAGVTGSVNHGVLPTPLLPVQVTIGGVDALLQYQGAAPDAVAGLLQVNAVVPATVAIGTAVPITLTIGGVKSPSGATVAIR